MYYRMYEVDEKTPVQFVGLYVTQWRPEFGQPTVMFAEVSDEENDMLNASQEMFDALKLAEQYLVARGHDHKGTPGGHLVLTVRKAISNAKGE